MMGQEVCAVAGPALLEGELGDLLVGELGRQALEGADAGDVGDGLDVEDEGAGHAIHHAGKTPVDR